MIKHNTVREMFKYFDWLSAIGLKETVNMMYDIAYYENVVLKKDRK